MSNRHVPSEAAVAYRMARVALRRLPTARAAACMSSTAAYAVTSALHDAQQLDRAWRLLEVAERRQWTQSAARLRHDLLRQGERLAGQAEALTATLRSALCGGNVAGAGIHQHQRPSWRLLLDELRQLEREFEHVEFDVRGHRLLARTEPIVLKELELGPFSIELRLDALARRPGADSFQCVALKPRPAATNSAVTHPHVQDKHLCAGDATAAIEAALSQGRLCDAFCLVRAVLSDYNESSPYVPVEDWDGLRCHDCETVVSRNEERYCEGCRHDVCADCYLHCDACGCGRCRGCMDYDDVAGTDLCDECRESCPQCGRTVDRRQIVEASELCPECHDERAAEDDADDDDADPPPQEVSPPTPEEPDGSETDPDRAAAAADAAAPATNGGSNDGGDGGDPALPAAA